RSLEVLRRLRERAGDRLTLVAVGGIETADDAWARIRAGATLVQGYTGLIYGRPLWPSRLHRGLARLVRSVGYRSVADAVGADVDEAVPKDSAPVHCLATTDARHPCSARHCERAAPCAI